MVVVMLLSEMGFSRKREDGKKVAMVIGDGNVFEFSSRCESRSVGNDNVFEAKS